MSDSPLLGLPYLAASQAQKHVTHNEALSMLDGLVHLAVVSRALATPPPNPADGARYLIAASSTGDWAGHAGQVALRMEGAWAFFMPREGWRLWVSDEDALIIFNGTSWNVIGGGGPLEGTFTPGMSFGGSSAGVTYAVQEGRYTKIGRRVFIDAHVVLTSNGSGSGAAKLTGLPFTSAASHTSGHTIVSVFTGGSSAGGLWIRADISATTASFMLPGPTSTSAAQETNILDTFDCRVSFSYMAES